MSTRHALRDFIQCLRCKHTQRLHRGYQPGPNPVLFDSKAHSKAYFEADRRAIGYHGVAIDSVCEGKCQGAMHSDWKRLDFQSYLKLKFPVK